MSFKGWFGFSKESHKRPHTVDRHGYNHSPYPPYYPNSPQHSQNGRFSVTEKVQDVSAPQAPISDQFLQKLIVLQDHCATKDLELTVRRGERIEVVRREGDFLFIRNERGKQGYVPSKNCAPPVASSSRRTRSNSRSSMPIRPVASGGESGSRSNISMFPCNSAGYIKRYDSPCEDPEQITIRRVSSPPSNVLSPLLSGPSSDTRQPREGSAPLEPKYSPSSSSGVASLSEPYSPALMRAYSHEELDRKIESGYSLGQSVIDPSDPHSNLDNQLADIYRKHSSSDDSGTMDMSKDYASTIRNGELSSDEGSCRRGSSASGGTTPSMINRPLPSPPKGHSQDTPPPVPPRFASLDRSCRPMTAEPLPIADDIDPYAQPVDIISSDSVQSFHKSHVKSHVDVHNQNSGINSPYSEVYRGGKGNKRPINLPEDCSSQTSRSGSFTRHRSPNSVKSSHGIERRGSPHTNGDKIPPPPPISGRHKRPPPLNGDKKFPALFDDNARDSPSPIKGVIKFRKCLWGVFLCTQNFDGCDENEVSVQKGEHVLVFNQEDSQWFWVVKHKTDNSEGFVPSTILNEMGTTENKFTPAVESLQSPTPALQQSRPSSATVPHRNRASTSSHYPSPSASHRSRLNSTGSSPIQKVHTAPSMERLPQGRIVPLSPSSPPPPYAEKDPIHHHQRQPIARNRPSYPGRSGRVSVPHPLYPSLQSGAHVSRSSTHLANTSLDNGYSHMTTPTILTPPVIGGTLV